MSGCADCNDVIDLADCAICSACALRRFVAGDYTAPYWDDQQPLARHDIADPEDWGPLGWAPT